MSGRVLVKLHNVRLIQTEFRNYLIIPFIIEDSKKGFYYRGLSEWRNEKGWLVDTCLDGQDTFIRLLDMLEIPHSWWCMRKR